MFYVRYLSAEIFRRFGKTLTIVFGLAIASAIIILIMSFSKGLSDSQSKVLDPLKNVGTDIMLTRSINASDLSKMDTTTREEFLTDNRMKIDFSKLGDPGAKFISDSFMSGTLLTYDTGVTKKFNSNQISDYAQGLILNINRSEGTIPKVTATIETGTRSMNVQITPEMRAKFEAAGGSAGFVTDGTKPPANASNSGGSTSAGTFAVNVPSQTVTKDVGPISTDINQSSYTVSGVDITKKNIGLILPNQIVKGAYFSGKSGEIIINKTYADKNNKNVGDEMTISNTKFKIVGVVDPKLYTNTTDFYLPLDVLQKLSGKTNRINIMLIKTTDAGNVDAVTKSLGGIMAGAKVVNSKDTADKVSGSLVQANKLTNKFIGVTSIIVIIAAFIIVSLLTIFSINKRTREIGTLKAIGWGNSQVTRQIVLENVVLGVIGALVGVGLGIAAIVVLNHYNISFDATVQSLNSSGGGPVFFARSAGSSSQSATNNVTTSLQLKVTFDYLIMALGAAVAILGAMVAAFFAALKVSRLKPQVALRNLE